MLEIKPSVFEKKTHGANSLNHHVKIVRRVFIEEVSHEIFETVHNPDPANVLDIHPISSNVCSGGGGGVGVGIIHPNL
jgi:hypothetical protein